LRLACTIGGAQLKVDGKQVQTITMGRTLRIILQWDESFDVGSDTRSGVNDDDYQVPFAFTGKIDKLTFNMGHPQMMAGDTKAAKEAFANAND
jgi:hypothetical protein